MYQRHDAAKDTYKRGHAAGLPIDEFEKLFSTFCFVTLAKRKYEFSDKELKEFFRESLAFANISKPVEAVIKDSVEAVCLLQPEGLQFVFVHRSFQEYFAAVFASRYRGENIHEVIDACVEGFGTGNFISLLDEIDKDVLDYHWVLPKIQGWLAKVGSLKLSSARGLKVFMENTIRRFSLDDDGYIRGMGLEAPHSLDWMIPADHSSSTRFHLSNSVFGQGKVGIRSSFKWDGPPDRKGLAKFEERVGLRGRPAGPISQRNQIYASDAPFLIKTELPTALAALRKKYEDAASSIQDRKQQKVAATTSLLKGTLA